ncbi:unnamed protein product [Caenorhabditis brenneri]
MKLTFLLLILLLWITVVGSRRVKATTKRPTKLETVKPEKPKNATCEPGYMTFKRPQGDWCVQFFSAHGEIDQPTAEAKCKSMGATLTGLQNDEEARKLADSANSFLVQAIWIPSVMWVGGKRNTSCTTKKSCSVKDTFHWTDNFTTGEFPWASEEPNEHYSSETGFEGCVQLYVDPWGTTTPHGKLNDIHCNAPSPMYGCGKRP